MNGKSLLFVSLIVASALLPAVLADDGWVDRWEAWWNRQSPTVEEADGSLVPQPGTSWTDPITGSEPSSLQPIPQMLTGVLPGAEVRPQTSSFPTVVGPVGTPLENLLSFEITPDWISENWSRVSTRTAELDLDGWRVALLSGHTDDDLTGSITYYFDRQRRMQRIVLHGYTASPARVIQLAQSRYSMKRIPRVGSNVYVAMIEDESIGALLVRHPLIIRDETRRVEILLELNRVETIYGMSAEFTKILEVAQQPDPAMLRERSSS